MAVAGELALFGAILLIGTAQGATLSPRATGAPPPEAAAWLALVGCGIKAGLVPLHVWLPLAHPAAPAPASAALSGVMLKAGIVGMLLLVPPELGAPGGLGMVMMVGGLFGAFAAAIYGTAQDDLKTALAYSSLSQMGLALTALGAAYAGLAPAEAVAAGLALFAVHHGLAKGALFLGAESGVPRAATVALMAVPALALTGAPLTSGYLSKSAFAGALEGDPLATAFTLAGFGTALLMARSLWLAWVRKPAPGAWRATGFAALSLASVALPALWPGGPAKLLSGPEPASIAIALAPAVVAFGVAVALLRLRPTPPPAPAGDALVLVELSARAASPMIAAADRGLARVAAHGEALLAKSAGAAAKLLEGRPATPPARWTAAGGALVVLLLAVALSLVA